MLKCAPMNAVTDKHIILGVCGSIAAYKIVELARNLTLDGAIVDVILTEAAERFVGIPTFQALTGRHVLTDMWSLPEDGVVGHVSLGQHADLVVIAPATANTIARLAAGISDDLLTTTVLATTAPVLCVPAMNPLMYANAATQDNIAVLQRRGMTVIAPAYGRMAEHVVGQGRMPEVAEIDGHLRALLAQQKGALRRRRVVVTAAGTHEPLDPVRFIGNRSSGRMGYALATEARDRGAQVTLISGPSSLTPPTAVEVVNVETALDMRDAVHSAIADADLLVMAAAVADFRPAAPVSHKIKKGNDETFAVQLIRNPDILAGLAEQRHFIKIGFAAETEDLLENARSKLERKGLDMIIANEAVASIGQLESQVTILDSDGAHPLPRQAQQQSAQAIFDAIVQRWPDRLGPKN
ncbi:MAG: bifunctional phosphopantothenoylcysteine decarboxylase/phosphopantothenate--cysteine ligase CoaBC [Chloroflexi bacterium AL-W]|nr:bifunctional phosphopantothenoylcysteine decarboxylase/phosphopantothenate--cysteine ligase CoaBC [Chloroflexi bacterium AL-N1]NOK68178.1 bifunctional phosphopantothenoylcysteine decarboxylase/phosphopantothenate--cysteine ligase CoaBC [Chloroflexi bacterium AL-N10]NOK73518.1 bifunctional phosphopantothenoylcysteine decarboxylase/phosphopantothenate--cysteine ligase CoaBC [Chloroflexi bacterium AL-N5]NOK84048.1 bifunctional phosphopantothenoylcysteine decarboxylase/phosphopantothenate--cystei